MHGLGLADTMTVVDVGSGWGEFGVRMHTGSVARGPGEYLRFGTWDIPASRARYIPVDACIDGTDLEEWLPPRRADFFVALEVIEHLKAPLSLLISLRARADRGVLVSTPNPETTDVLGMDATHKTPIKAEVLKGLGFHVERASFYGQPDDSLFAVWSPEFV